MRNLTIKREKSFVGCLVKMKVYIEDPASGEIVIDSVSYRKIGELKNGEEKTFSIGENACNIIIIADKVSKNYCNELYKIPAGEDDVSVSGKNRFNLAAGNAFRFNGVTDSEILQNRKKGTKKGIIILAVAIVIGVIAGFLITSSLLSDMSNKPKEFSKQGMTVTLTNQFREVSQDGYTVCYDSKKVAVLVLKEAFSLVPGLEECTLKEYGDLVITNNNLDSSVKMKNSDGLTYFEYQAVNPDNKETCQYFSVVYKTSDSFWMIQFAALEDDYKDNKKNMIDWAKSIAFSNT